MARHKAFLSKTVLHALMGNQAGFKIILKKYPVGASKIWLQAKSDCANYDLCCDNVTTLKTLGSKFPKNDHIVKHWWMKIENKKNIKFWFDNGV